MIMIHRLVISLGIVRGGLTSSDQTQQFRVNLLLIPTANDFYINNQKLVDLSLQPLPRKHETLGVAFLKSVIILIRYVLNLQVTHGQA